MSAVTQVTPRNELSVLVVQMGETEEVYRALMALKAVKHLYPDLKIHFATRKEISRPARCLDWIQSVIETPSFNQGEDPVAKVATWIDQVINQHYDISINWTFSDRYARMAGLVTALVPAMVKLGDYIRNDFTLGSYDAWSMYRRAWLKNGISQDIHHTDIITTQLLTALQIHAGDPNPDAGFAAVTSRYFFRNDPVVLPAEWMSRPKNLKWTAIHAATIGERGSEWIEMILRRHPDAGVVIVGDQKCTWEIDSNPRVIDLSAQIQFDCTVQILSQCAWLLTGRNSIADLAALINLRVIYCIEPQVGGAGADSLQWTEEGPYGNSHVVVISDFKPELVYGVWSYYASEWFHKGSITFTQHFDNLSLASALNEIQVFKSRIRPAQEGGGVCFERIDQDTQSFESWMYRIRGQMARAWFCGWLPSIEAEVSKVKLNPHLIKRVRELKESLKVLDQLAVQGHQISNDLRSAAEGLKNQRLMSVDDRAAIDEHAKKLVEVEALVERVIQVEPELQGILLWYRQMMHNLTGDSIAHMAKESIHAFDLLSEGVELLSLYAQKTLDLARPKAVTGSVTALNARSTDA